MNLYESVSKNFLENKQINIRFSKTLNKKEKDFLKFLFVKYNLSETLKKTTVVSEITVKDILRELKYSTVKQLEKFLVNLQSKRLMFTVHDKRKPVLSGSFPVFSSYNIIYDKMDFIFPREIFYSKRENNLFSLLKFDFLLFMGDETSYNLYTHLISVKGYRNSTEVPLVELKEILDSNEKYPRFFDFENKVLRKTVESINLFSDIKLEYKKIKAGDFKNNKIEKIEFLFNNAPSDDKMQKRQNLNNDINIIMELIGKDIKNFHSVYELIKSYIIRRDFEYVYKNYLFIRTKFKNFSEKNFKKALLLDLANASSKEITTEIVNIRKIYTIPFYIQLDISTSMSKNNMSDELQVLLDTGFFNKVNTLKDNQIIAKKFDNFKIFIHYFKNKESVLKIDSIHYN